MKPVLAFVAGVFIASGVGYMVSNRQSEPQPVSASSPAAVSPQPAASTPQLPPAVGEPAPDSPSVSEPPRKQADVRPSPAPVKKPAPQMAAVTPAPVNQAPVTQAPVAAAPQPAPAPPLPAPVREEPAIVASVRPAPVEEAVRPAPRQPQTVTIPAGTMLSVRLGEALASDRSFQGDQFRATLDQPLIVDHMVIAERGSRVTGRVVDVDKGGKVRGVAQIGIELTALNTSDGQRVQLRTERFQRSAETTRRSDAAKVGAGAGIGAIIGAIAGGGKGAAVGAGLGGAAGAGDVLLTRGKPAQLPVETKLSFRLSEPITITERLHE